jgi:DnaJ homolog subfamily B member 4
MTTLSTKLSIAEQQRFVKIPLCCRAAISAIYMTTLFKSNNILELWIEWHETNLLYVFLFWRKPTTVEEILTIEIKPGWKKGTKITFPEKGNEQRGLIPADLVFIIDEKPHTVFKRDGNDLVVTQKISLVEALTGYTAQITTLDGRNLTVPVNTIISPSYEEVIKGEGMPIPKEPSKKGNLRVKFNVKFPSRLTSEQKTGIKRLLTSS